MKKKEKFKNNKNKEKLKKNKEKLKNVLDGYFNDGYIYCLLISFQNTPLVKIGKVGMKLKESEQQVINKLRRRYNTYYPEYEICYFMRASNYHKAEVYIFDLLKELHYKREIYYHDPVKIKQAFEKTSLHYPNIQSLILDSTPHFLTKLNHELREQEQEKEQEQVQEQEKEEKKLEN